MSVHLLGNVHQVPVHSTAWLTRSCGQPNGVRRGAKLLACCLALEDARCLIGRLYAEPVRPSRWLSTISTALGERSG